MTTIQIFFLTLIGTSVCIIIAAAVVAAFASRQRMEDWDKSMAARLRKKYDEDNERWWS